MPGGRNNAKMKRNDIAQCPQKQKGNENHLSIRQRVAVGDTKAKDWGQIMKGLHPTKNFKKGPAWLDLQCKY